MTDVVKRSGRVEEFDERKVYASIYITCVHADTDADCEQAARQVANAVAQQVEDISEVLSVEIRKLARNALHRIDEDLAHEYYTHRGASART